jgi:hypothetical protein
MKLISILKSTALVSLCLVSISACHNEENSKLKTADSDCVQTLMDTLQVDPASAVDAEVLQQVLMQDMYLGDLSSVRQLFAAEADSQTSMSDLIQRMHGAVLNRHPAIYEFTCRLNQSGLIAKDNVDLVQIKRTLHHSYALNKIIRNMIDDPKFMTAVYDHLLARRKEFGISEALIPSFFDIYRVSGDLFTPVKALSIDAVFVDYDKIRNGTSEVETKSRARSLSINILEATLTDSFKGNVDNAMAGIAMIMNPAPSVYLKGAQRSIGYAFNQEWTSLYETWNLSFITGHLPNLHILYPKLIIPEVIDANPEDYVFNRVLALGLSANFTILAQAQGKPTVTLPQAAAITKIWGTVNETYATAYVARYNQKNLRNYRFLLSGKFSDVKESLVNFLRTFPLTASLFRND